MRKRKAKRHLSYVIREWVWKRYFSLVRGREPMAECGDYTYRQTVALSGIRDTHPMNLSLFPCLLKPLQDTLGYLIRLTHRGVCFGMQFFNLGLL